MLKLTNKHLIIIAVVLIAIIFGLVAYVRHLNIDSKIDKKQTEANTTKEKIDVSLIAIDNELNHLSEQSEKTAREAKKLTKKIKYEKPIIRDAPYDSMCKYITNYVPE